MTYSCAQKIFQKGDFCRTMLPVQMPRQLQTLDDLLAQAGHYANHSMRNIVGGSQLIVGTGFVSDGWFWDCQWLKNLRHSFFSHSIWDASQGLARNFGAALSGTNISVHFRCFMVAS